MTQAKRKTNIVPMQFEECDPLPKIIPPQWDCAMCNRVFKTKVIWQICHVLPQLVCGAMHGKQRLIVDFMDKPVEYSKIPLKSSQVNPEKDLPFASFHGFTLVLFHRSVLDRSCTCAA